MATERTLRIGTRASKLARWQCDWVAEQLRRRDVNVEIIEIATSGDVQQAGPVAAMGGTGVFTKEIQAALLAGEVDLAVHSLKDLPTQQVAGLMLAATPQRENPADALVAASGHRLESLPAGSRVGTGSLRRRAQILALRSDLTMLDIRGNVDTRLRKLDEGQYDAIVLAAAGLTRLGWADRITDVLAPPRVLPAPGQGSLALECRSDDFVTQGTLAPLDDSNTRAAVVAERTLLAVLEGGCSAPVAAWGRVVKSELRLDGLVASPDGRQVLRATGVAPVTDATDLGTSVARDLLDQGAAAIVGASRGG